MAQWGVGICHFGPKDSNHDAFWIRA